MGVSVNYLADLEVNVPGLYNPIDRIRLHNLTELNPGA